MSEASPEFLAAWLIDIGEKAGKGVVDNLDGRALARVGNALKDCEQARQAAEARAQVLSEALDKTTAEWADMKAAKEQAEAKLAKIGKAHDAIERALKLLQAGKGQEAAEFIQGVLAGMEVTE